MGKSPQLPTLQPGQDGGHAVSGSESESGLPVPLLSSGRLRTSRHHHRRQVSDVLFSSYCSTDGPDSFQTPRHLLMKGVIKKKQLYLNIPRSFKKNNWLLRCQWSRHLCYLVSASPTQTSGQHIRSAVLALEEGQSFSHRLIGLLLSHKYTEYLVWGAVMSVAG